MKVSSIALALSFFGAFVQAIEPPRKPSQPQGGGSKILTYNETVLRPSFGARSTSVNWFAGGEDGTGLRFSDSGDIVFENFITGKNEIFVPSSRIPRGYAQYWIRPDLKKVLFAVNYSKQYRHSYFADYLILDVATGQTTPIVADQAGDIQYAEFAPTGDAIAFVRGNDIYLNIKGQVTQITRDGGPDTFNGVPDWVYEEEIFGDRKTLWWSPDGEYVAYLRFDETGVETFRVPYYMNNQKIAPAYPRELELRYPKVGTTNPTVTFHLLEVSSLQQTDIPIDAFAKDDTVIGEVAWLTDAHSKVIVRAFNRVQDKEKLVLVNVDTGKTKVVRQRDGSDGWLDNNIAITYIGTVDRRRSPRNNKKEYYVDLSDHSGWNHIYLYPVDGGNAITLTRGRWEVTAILKVDTDRQIIYFQSTKQHSTSRHIYSVSYKTDEVKALVDDSVPASYSASFSSGAGFYLLTYRGPDVPYQELYATNSSKPLRTVTDNLALYNKLKEYKLPKITYLELKHPEGFTINVMQRLPANFDPSKKYPVLFIPYGGPGAQQVSQAFSSLNWNAYIASDPELEFITWTVDGRGTGYKGRKFRSAVASHLGRYETQDQIFAAQELIKRNSFVDKDKIGIWGWSYGGYLSAKVLEADSGLFNYALIIAPVSDFRFYDSMYTERYMKTYEQNPAGYNETAVRKTDGFKNIKGKFSILHGTGDDNVHYQNAAALVDLLVGQGVGPDRMDMFAFTDSDHGIFYNGAYQWLYKYLTGKLFEEKKRVVGQPEIKHQWSKKGVPVRNTLPVEKKSTPEI
ncbi:diacylglycerol pyrophosphate phosphatase [Orbilia oligospora]|uniref:dipeptidyl-peptidase IV n=1 Tax=Orbilia oligospora TaxID=2813651 RepID=A0A8H8UQE2_ORBOL|nr:diacylglycerol pyrophosphate phosphatase [Orbilia oligospora]